jgi:hypothetical protein
MIDDARLHLKRKYALVHVPNDEKVRLWEHATRAAIRRGLGPEEAGWLAARGVVPYEAKQPPGADLPAVEEILRELK